MLIYRTWALGVTPPPNKVKDEKNLEIYVG